MRTARHHGMFRNRAHPIQCRRLNGMGASGGDKLNKQHGAQQGHPPPYTRANTGVTARTALLHCP